MIRSRDIAVPPQLLVLGGIASVQFGSAFAAQLFDRAGPAGVVLLRLAFAAVALMLAIRPALRGRTRPELTSVVVFGLILGGMNWSFYEALHRLPLGVAVTVEFVGPLAIAIAGSRRVLDLLWAAMAATGVGLLAGNAFGGALSITGLLLAMLAGTCWAGYIFASKRVGASLPGLSGLAVALCVGTVLVLPAGIVEAGGALFEPGVLLRGLLIALLSSVVPYSLEMIALRRLPAKVFGLMMSLEPAAAALAGLVVLSQGLTLRTGTAILVVVAASVGITLQSRAETPVPRDV